MWADSLHLAEQQHLIRLFIWSEASLLIGGLMLAFLLWRRVSSPLLRHFAIQTAAWGAVFLCIAFVWWRSLGVRDHAAAVRLDQLMWLNIGLDTGYLAVGATLAVIGWLSPRRLGLVGAGIAILLQGGALLALDHAFVQQITR